MKKLIKYNNFTLVLSLLLGFIPLVAYGFSLADSTFRSSILYVISLIGILIPILFALAFIVFFWGLSKFILKSDNEKDVANGKNYMFWGIIVLFILVSFRAIVGLISDEFEFGDATKAPILKTNTAP